jgi:hypothetical protein
MEINFECIAFLPFQYIFQTMHIPTIRDISTTGTMTEMSKIGVVFLFLCEQYASLLFEHTGFPSNLVTQVDNIHKKSAQKISVDLQSYDFNMINLLIVLLKNSTLQMKKLHGLKITDAVTNMSFTSPLLKSPR